MAEPIEKVGKAAAPSAAVIQELRDDLHEGARASLATAEPGQIPVSIDEASKDQHSVQAVTVAFNGQTPVIDALTEGVQVFARFNKDPNLERLAQDVAKKGVTPEFLAAYQSLIAAGQLSFQDPKGQSITPKPEDKPAKGSSMVLIDSPTSLKEACAMLVAMGFGEGNVAATGDLDPKSKKTTSNVRTPARGLPSGNI